MNQRQKEDWEYIIAMVVLIPVSCIGGLIVVGGIAYYFVEFLFYLMDKINLI